MSNNTNAIKSNIKHSTNECLSLLEQQVFECEQLLTHAKDLTSLMQAQPLLRKQPGYCAAKDALLQKHLELKNQIDAKQLHLVHFKQRLLTHHQENKDPSHYTKQLRPNLRQTLTEIRHYRSTWQQLVTTIEQG